MHSRSVVSKSTLFDKTAVKRPNDLQQPGGVCGAARAGLEDAEYVSRAGRCGFVEIDVTVGQAVTTVDRIGETDAESDIERRRIPGNRRQYYG